MKHRSFLLPASRTKLITVRTPSILSKKVSKNFFLYLLLVLFPSNLLSKQVLSIHPKIHLNTCSKNFISCLIFKHFIRLHVCPARLNTFSFAIFAVHKNVFILLINQISTTGNAFFILFLSDSHPYKKILFMIYKLIFLNQIIKGRFRSQKRTL